MHLPIIGAEPVSAEVVQRYFIASELSKLARILDWPVPDELPSDLDPDYLWAICSGLQAMHNTYVAEYLGRDDYQWFQGTCLVSDIIFQDADRTADTTTGGIQRDKPVLEFAGQLKLYYKEHEPGDDPSGYDEYRYDPDRPLLQRAVILHERAGRVYLLDGNHRLMRQVFAGATEVECYFGRPTGPAAPRTSLIEIRRLRDLWATTKKPKLRKSLLRVTRHLMKHSPHARFAVELYWVMYGESPEMQAAGRKLLGRDPAGPDRRYDTAVKAFV